MIWISERDARSLMKNMFNVEMNSGRKPDRKSNSTKGCRKNGFHGFLMVVGLLSRTASATHMKSKNNRAPLTVPVLWPRWVNEKLSAQDDGAHAYTQGKVQRGCRSKHAFRYFREGFCGEVVKSKHFICFR